MIKKNKYSFLTTVILTLFLQAKKAVHFFGDLSKIPIVLPITVFFRLITFQVF